MPDFVAENNYYGKPLNDDEENRLPEILKPKGLSDSFINNNEVLDLPKMTIQNFYDELQTTIEKRSPMFLWSKERANEKLRLDNEKQILIFNKIQNLRAIAEEFLKLKAEAIFSQEFIKNLIAEKRMMAEQYFESAVAEHRKKLTAIKTEIDLNSSLVDHDQIAKDRKRAENEAIRAENLIKYAQADKIKAEAQSIQAQNELKTMIMSKIDFSSMPPVYTTYLLSALSGLNAEAFTDLDIKEKLKEVFINLEETKAKRAQAEVDDFINSAEFRKWKNNRAKEDAGL